MKKRLFALTFGPIIGLVASIVGFAVSSAQSTESEKYNLDEDTFIKIPALEFTVATVHLDRYLTSLPLGFARTEQALSQVHTGVGYKRGMVWLTFKLGDRRSLLSQVRKYQIKKRVRSSWRLTPSPSHQARKTRSERRPARTAGTHTPPAPVVHADSGINRSLEATVTG